MAKMIHPQTKREIDVEPERQAMYLSAGWRLKSAPKKTTVTPTDDK